MIATTAVGTTAMIVAAVMAQLANVVSTMVANKQNVDMQNQINETSIANTESTNAQRMAEAEMNREFQLQSAQHGLEWKVADAKAAGINPLYAVGGGTQVLNGSMPALSTPNLNAARVQPLDFSGMSNLITSLTNNLMTQEMINDRNAANIQAKSDYFSASTAKNVGLAELYNSKAAYYRRKDERRNKLNPDWLEEYRKHFEDEVEDL